MNNDRLEAIRALCHSTITGTYELNSAMKIRDACLELLEAYTETKLNLDAFRKHVAEPHEIRELVADRDRWKARAEHAEEMLREYEPTERQALIAETDRWKARADEYYAVSQLHEKRAEALERAIKLLPHRATNAACHICRHQAKPDKFMCENPGGGCRNGDYVGWQFDEARFAGDMRATP